MRRQISSLLVLAMLAGAATAGTPTAKPAAAPAGGKAGDAADKHEAPKDPRATARFPQRVRVGDLPGRRLLEPEEQQHVLGWTQGVVRAPDGGTELVVEIGGWLGWLGIGTRLVAVPTDDVALLGEHLALMDIEPDELRALPAFAPGAAKPLGANETIRMGVVKPFH